MKTEILQPSAEFAVTNWTPELAHDIHQHLEVSNWSPWLAASQASLAGRSLVFPQGQLLLMENATGLPAASLSTNRIHWGRRNNRAPKLG